MSWQADQYDHWSSLFKHRDGHVAIVVVHAEQDIRSLKAAVWNED